ncbi:peptide ABC transporter substrate-binding protein [Sphaerisporangium siamense]|uniref:Peptide/nickel transport system substrate-binding protein n=1 Tax=Sphaerisporangium siamense TaxID=795645 RepID=A0A7W7DCS5_9ACTN|nr:ABC transporter substrate-binding protein [Sphaerisporangium siamense]MBB4704417.1 peptide/nickel transport system substrate-binding protein [Sphaerisporangium siamense]GII84899.1 peptide ABC transporter substrate-binding protein [Sphaerisporangium siamense]
MTPKRRTAMVAALLLLPACSGATRGGDGGDEGGSGRQVLRVLTVNMPRSLDPVDIDAQRMPENGLADTLVVQNDDATLRPGLATRWRLLKPTLWEFDIRPGVRFWSGAPADAAAVKASFERHQRRNTRVKSLLSGLEFVAAGPTTLRVRTGKPVPGLPFQLSFFALGVHNAAEAERRGEDFKRHPDLTGFMKPVRFVPGETLVAEANPHYWGLPPGGSRLKGIEARLGADSQGRTLALRAGDADADYNMEIDQQAQYERARPAFQVYATVPTTRNIWLNLGKAPALRDRAVRTALDLAADRRALIDGLNHGYARPATGHFPAGLPYAITTGTRTDVEKAKSVLDAAGWVPGPDGVRARGGTRLHFRILTYAVFQPLAIALQSQWRRIGVGTELAPVETTASNQMMLDGDFEIATYCSCGSATGDIAGQLRAFYRTGVVTNYGGYSNPDADRLIDELGTEFDQGRQYALAKRIQEIVRGDVALLYLYASTQWGAAYTGRVRGVDPKLSKRVVPGMWIAG